MTIIRKAYAEDFERIHPLFSGFHSQPPDKETFRQLFVRRWNSSEDHFGYLLEENDQVVGFLGTLFSTRIINGRTEKFCNMTTWIVQESYRTEGLSLLFQVLNKHKDMTITNFTGARVVSILETFGFRRLDERSKILLPSLHFSTLRCSCRILLTPDEIETHLDDSNQRIFQDHRPFKYPHVLVYAKDDFTYLIVKKVKRKRLPLAELHYLGNKGFFLHHIPHFLPALCLRLGVVGLIIGEHFLGNQMIYWGFSIPQRQPRLFRSVTMSGEEMDTIYSELQVLNL